MLKNLLVIMLGIVIFLTGVFLGKISDRKEMLLRLAESNKVAERYHTWVRMYDIWMINKKENKEIGAYLLQKGYRKIAIYGMSFLGIRLYYELKDSNVNVKYGLDRNETVKIVGLDIKNPDMVVGEDIDAVIVTALLTYDEIESYLKKREFKNIIAFDELLYDLLKS